MEEITISIYDKYGITDLGKKLGIIFAYGPLLVTMTDYLIESKSV